MQAAGTFEDMGLMRSYIHQQCREKPQWLASDSPQKTKPSAMRSRNNRDSDDEGVEFEEVKLTPRGV